MTADTPSAPGEEACDFARAQKSQSSDNSASEMVRAKEPYQKIGSDTMMRVTQADREAAAKWRADSCDVDMTIGDWSDLVQAFARHRLAATADRDAVEERMGEALFHLSDRLQAIGALDSDNVHAAYERVVAAWSALSTPAGEDRP